MGSEQLLKSFRFQTDDGHDLALVERIESSESPQEVLGCLNF